MNYPVIIGCTLVLAAAAYCQIPAVTLVQTGSAPKAAYTIHNDSSVAITAFIVRSKERGNGYELRDGFMQANGALPPGGHDTIGFGVLVTVVYADGSTGGDAEWARLFQLRRQYQFEALADAMAELEAGMQRHDPNLANTLETLRKERKKAALDGASRSLTEDLFEGNTPEQTAANIQTLADDWRIMMIDSAYDDLTRALERQPQDPKGNLAGTERVERVLEKFRHTRDQLIAAQPELARQPG